MKFDIPTFITGTLFGGLTMALVNHFLAKSRSSEATQISRFHNAADDFRASVAQEVILWHNCINGEPHLISYHSGKNPVDILLKSTIRAAIIQFSPFITENIGDFDKTYAAYEKHKKQTSFASGELFCNKGIKLLNQLLEFTEK